MTGLLSGLLLVFYCPIYTIDRAMATKPSTAAEKSLQKIQDQVTCGICLEPYTQPKLLKCFHVFCEKCLQSLVRRSKAQEQSLACPHCHQDTALPASGVQGLQGAFYIHYLFDIQDALQKVSSSNQTMCNKCKKREAACFCRTCGFVCQRCVEFHQEWEEYSTHEIIDLDTLTGSVTTLVPPLKNTLFCSKHPAKEADLYCDECDELICRDCIVRVHRDHQYDLVPESFAKQEKVIVTSLSSVEQQLATLHRAVESLDARCATIIEQKTAVVAEIGSAITQLQQALEERKTELVSQAEQIAQLTLNNLAAQRDELELKIAQLKSCHDFVEESRRTCSQGEILRMKSSLVKQIDDLTGSFKPETLALAEPKQLKLEHRLHKLMKTCQQFGKVYCHQVCPEKCRTSGEGIKVAMRGQVAVLSVEAFDSKGVPYTSPVDSLTCELVTSDSSHHQVRGTVERRDQNSYDITYQPEHLGKHQLHILIGGRPILNSPFTVTVLPNFTVPTNIITNLNRPWGIAVMEGGEMAATERNCNCVSIISANGEKKSFGTHGSAPGQFNYPEGVAMDGEGSILVCDYNNHRIQQFSPTGKHLKSVGTNGNGPLQFNKPIGIAVHSHTHKVYIADTYNHRIQLLNSDLTYSSSFGSNGSNNGEFNYPYDISTDSAGNVYVVDCSNHRIQVFSSDGQYLRQFGRKGKGEGELDHPTSIAIDSHNVVYVTEWGNRRVSIFTSDGEFIIAFGCRGYGPVQFDGLFGIGLDKNGTVYVCDTFNDRIQIFI